MSIFRDNDGNGNLCLEVCPPGETYAIRITLIPKGWQGFPNLRIQIRQEDGHVRFGPEIPISVVPEFIASLVKLALRGDLERVHEIVRCGG